MGKPFFEILREEFSGYGTELLSDIRKSVADARNEDAQDAARLQWEIGVEKAVAAMLDLGVPDEKIIAMLQKHWDFRLSEATDYINGYKKWKSDHE